jgi:hypothetical protein
MAMIGGIATRPIESENCPVCGARIVGAQIDESICSIDCCGCGAHYGYVIKTSAE